MVASNVDDYEPIEPVVLKTMTRIDPSEQIKLLYHDSLFETVTNKSFGFSVSVVSATPTPQIATYMGLHQCYSETPVKRPTKLSDIEAGEIAVKRLLEGDRGHYSPTEAASISLVLGGINHGTIQQLTRSRIGVSFSVQSFRYTSEHILKSANGTLDDVENVVYLRPCGKYHDREKAYEYDSKTRAEDLSLASFCVKSAAKRLREGMPSEQARGMLPFDYRQNCMVTFNTRSLMGFFDRRSKQDAQAEIRALSELMLEKFHQWQPTICDWYVKHRWGKARLAP